MRLLNTASVLLAVLLLGTLATRQFSGSLASDEVPAEQSRLVEEALDAAAEDLRSRVEDLGRRAAVLAGNRALAAALAELSENEEQAVNDLVTVMADQNISALGSMEVYDPTPRLRAWNGFTMPMDTAPEDARFLSNPLVRLAVDEDRRAALVHWQPVTLAGETVGVIRAMELVRVRVPVRNEYLNDISLEDDWERLTGLTIRVRYDSEASPGARLIHDRDGQPLLSISAVPPSLDELSSGQRRRFDDLAVAWVALLALVLGLRALLWIRSGVDPFVLRSTLTALVLVAWRLVWLALRVPERWQGGKRPLAPLFDPAHIASDLGIGLFRSSGDLILTALALVALAALVYRDALRRSPPTGWQALSPGLAAPAAGALYGLWASALFGLQVLVVHRLVLDSTLGYFDRSGLLPQRLVVVVFGSMLLLLLAAALLRVAMGIRWIGRQDFRRTGGVALLGGVAVGVALGLVALTLLPLEVSVLEIVALVFFAAICLAAALRVPTNRRLRETGYHLRSILTVVVLH
ncbi:MAG: hypothetical protein HKN29_09265, partial [Rhodothermales bacterium]|nr:hypothetical protein [Rhodothermales bacterium]